MPNKAVKRSASSAKKSAAKRSSAKKTVKKSVKKSAKKSATKRSSAKKSATKRKPKTFKQRGAGSDSHFLVQIFDSDYALEALRDSDALSKAHGEYIDVHIFRHTSSVIRCLISAYKASFQQITNLLTKQLKIEYDDLQIKQIDLYKDLVW